MARATPVKRCRGRPAPSSRRVGEFAEIARLDIEGNSLAIGGPSHNPGAKAFAERGILEGQVASTDTPNLCPAREVNGQNVKCLSRFAVVFSAAVR